MAITKETVVDQVTIVENYAIGWRETTRIMEDGVELSKQYHRSSVHPGDDISKAPDVVKQVADTLWTTQVIADFQAQTAGAN